MRFIDKDTTSLWYFTKHGVQPGSIPSNCHVDRIVDTPSGTYFVGDRVLSTTELADYDIFEKVPSKEILIAYADEIFREDVESKEFSLEEAEAYLDTKIYMKSGHWEFSINGHPVLVETNGNILSGNVNNQEQYEIFECFPLGFTREYEKEYTYVSNKVKEVKAEEEEEKYIPNLERPRRPLPFIIEENKDDDEFEMD